MWDSLEWVWGSECGAGGFVVGVCCVCVCGCMFRYFVVVSRGNLMWSECGAGGFVVGGCVCECVAVCVGILWL